MKIEQEQENTGKFSCFKRLSGRKICSRSEAKFIIDISPTPNDIKHPFS